MFDIEGSHIAKLNDTDLRTLVTRLCVAELRQAGLPVSAVTAGGDQNAPDGGVDVRVELAGSHPKTDFIARLNTGFQVKTSKMPRSAILKEMRPHGQLREMIGELAKVGGAYIIASGQDSTADKSLQKERRKAMHEAVADLPDAESLHLDFFDQTRLASWVRVHPGVVAWVREKIGEPFSGWQVHGGDWPKSGVSVDAEYLLDGQCRLHDGHSQQEGGLPMVQGIQRIREILGQSKGVVRLVGLSGTGKTRLLQALFDNRIGANALPTELALYTDIADDPEPSPKDLLHHLVHNRLRAVLIVDNCLPNTHRSLTNVCTEAASLISLITVEYDVGEDEPEKTEVFRLEPSTDELIERLLEQRRPQTSQVDRHRMAELAGGNARLALALANTTQHGESIAKLTDKELFERLFYQQQGRDTSLLNAAKACSLVYSFDGETLQGDEAELPLLAGLAGLTADQLYSCLAELKRRQLVQCRGQWRAVLPQALAIWLARRALEEFPPERIETAMLEVRSGRLLRSFSRRLGCLHDSEAAQTIVRRWLSPDGLLADIGQLNSLGVEILRNIAPVQQDLVLDKLEYVISEHSGIDYTQKYLVERNAWIYVLKSLAYEPQYFDRAANLLARLAIAESKVNNHDSARNSFKRLFQLYLSGTHAPVEQRLRIIEKLLRDEIPANQDLAMEALNSLLAARNFSGASDYAFGARPRDYGWQPSYGKEFFNWYKAAIEFSQRLAMSDSTHAIKARSILANQFRSLWIQTGMFNELETMALALNAQQFWPEGWLAVIQTINSNGKAMPSNLLTRLRLLEKALHPVNLLQTVRAYLSSETWRDIAIEDKALEEGINGKTPDKSLEQAQNRMVTLGHEIAKQSELLDELLPILVHRKSYRCWEFGRGLALRTDSLSNIWQRLVQAFTATTETERDVTVLRGFLNGGIERDPLITGSILDAAVHDPLLGPIFPWLQNSVGLDGLGVERLQASLKRGLAPAWIYKDLALGRSTDPIPYSAFRQLILDIAYLPDGLDIAIDILQMRLFSAKLASYSIDQELVQCGRELLRQCYFEHQQNFDSYELAEVITACLNGSDAASDAQIICRRLAETITKFGISIVHEYGESLKSLFQVQTHIALDEFLTGQTIDMVSLFIHDMEPNWGNPLISVPIESLIYWARIDPKPRFPKLATIIPLFANEEQNGALGWSTIALSLLESAPDKPRVLAEYQQRFKPSSWSGSLANILEKYRALPQALLTHPDIEVSAWAREQDADLARKAADRRIQERERERQRDERFE